MRLTILNENFGSKYIVIREARESESLTNLSIPGGRKVGLRSRLTVKGNVILQFTDDSIWQDPPSCLLQAPLFCNSPVLAKIVRLGVSIPSERFSFEDTVVPLSIQGGLE